MVMRAILHHLNGPKLALESLYPGSKSMFLRLWPAAYIMGGMKEMGYATREPYSMTTLDGRKSPRIKVTRLPRRLPSRNHPRRPNMPPTPGTYQAWLA